MPLVIAGSSWNFKILTVFISLFGPLCQVRATDVLLPPGACFVVANCLAESKKAETAAGRCVQLLLCQWLLQHCDHNAGALFGLFSRVVGGTCIGF